MPILDRYTGLLLSILRIVSGLLFLEHGAAKLLHFPPTEMFATAPAVGSLFWIAGVLELVGGALLVIGLFTPVVAFVLSGEMAVAYWTVHAKQSFYPVLNQGDAAVLFCFVFLYLAAAGAGPLSADALFFKKKS
ncbi:MAG TPA: DoxX family protein [Caulobacterales bacterium]|nr:DoxX family protein [Caulobacterales bacterium]